MYCCLGVLENCLCGKSGKETWVGLFVHVVVGFVKMLNT
jgi:hypothetical protein